MMNQTYLGRESQLLSQIREGKRVYDWDNEYVGRVRYVQFPSEMADDTSDYAEKRLSHVADDVRKQLLREGYLQVGGGLFSPDYYILSSQITAVIDEAVSLNVMKAEIIRF